MPSSAMRGPHPLGHGAEVLAHDDRAGPVRLERDQRVELLGPVRHVGAVPGVEALGDPVQALQAHDVVDPQEAACRRRAGASSMK